ncbi:MAG: ABC transporter ATP-binding protein, partial [Desulfobacterales bacterium]
MKKPAIPVVKRSLISWVFAENLKLQILLVLIILVMVGARVVPLEMQKRVVNEAINLGRIDLLIRYCAIYLAAVIATSAFKFLTNALQVIISQRATAAMRKRLYEHILNLPLPFFRNTSAGMVVASLVNELTMPGNFIGMAVAVPISNVLTLVAFTGYLVWLNPTLAVLSLSIYPALLFLVPVLQKQVNRANRKRVDLTRDISSKVTESITGIHEIQGNGAHGLENGKFGRLVDFLYRVRVRWSMFRDAIKITNGFFTSLGPFLIFLIGGYLAIKGQLALGALVAFLSAQEKLYEPWKELIEFYQVYQDAQVSYQRTMDYFDAPTANPVLPDGRAPYELAGDLEVENLSMATADGITLLDRVSFSLPAGEHMALVGFSGSGKSTLALCLAQLYRYTGGHIRLAGKEVADLTKMDMAHTMGIVSQSPFIFDGTLEENLLYGVAALKLTASEDRIRVSRASASTGQDPAPPPEDSRKAGVSPTRDDMIRVLHHTGLFADTLRFGLNTQLAAEDHPDLSLRLVAMRDRFQAEFGESLARYVEFFDVDAYLTYSSVAANLIFGTPRRASFSMDRLPANPHF